MTTVHHAGADSHVPGATKRRRHPPVQPPIFSASNVDPDASGRTFSEPLAALWDRLSPMWQGIVKGPLKASDQHREFVRNCALTLRKEAGWTPELAIELATHYQDGQN